MADPLGELSKHEMRRVSRLLEDLRDGGGPPLYLEDVKVVRQIPILWTNWELNHTGWLLDTPVGRIALIEAATKIWDVPTMLRDRIIEYQLAIEATEQFLNELEHGTGSPE